MCRLLGCSDKMKVLHHHPDKRKARGLPVKGDEDDYFTCITRGNFVFYVHVELMPLTSVH